MAEAFSEVGGSYLLVMTTVKSKDEARAIARHAITARLAACAQISSVDSTYVWRDELVEDAESLVMLKTRSALYARLEDAIRSMHTYEVPEIVALPILGGNLAYIRWIDSMTEDGST